MCGIPVAETPLTTVHVEVESQARVSTVNRWAAALDTLKVDGTPTVNTFDVPLVSVPDDATREWLPEPAILASLNVATPATGVLCGVTGSVPLPVAFARATFVT